MYVPDTGKWISFFKKSVESNSIRAAERKRVGLGGTEYVSSTVIVPIEGLNKGVVSTENADVTLVSPVAQTVQQAKLEIRRENKTNSNKRKNRNASNHNKQKKKKKKNPQKDNFD